MRPFWRGFFSVIFFGRQPCWFFGHDMEIDWKQYKSAPDDLVERMTWAFEVQVWYGPLKRICRKCGKRGS